MVYVRCLILRKCCTSVETLCTMPSSNQCSGADSQSSASACGLPASTIRVGRPGSPARIWLLCTALVQASVWDGPCRGCISCKSLPGRVDYNALSTLRAGRRPRLQQGLDGLWCQVPPGIHRASRLPWQQGRTLWKYEPPQGHACQRTTVPSTVTSRKPAQRGLLLRGCSTICDSKLREGTPFSSGAQPITSCPSRKLC